MHFHVQIVDDRTGQVTHAHSHTLFRDESGAAEQAARTATEMAAGLRGTQGRIVEAGQCGVVAWRDQDGGGGRRTVVVVACEQPLDLRPVDIGTDSA